MTTYTETQTVTHALRRAGLLGDDETPSSEQLDLATKTYTSRLSSLQVRGLNMWGWTPDTVPQELFDPLADYMAMFLIPTAGGPRPSDADVMAQEGTLRAICAAMPSYDVAAGQYF
jgi:hypothetical protein